MANETTLTIIGNTTAPAELRFTPSGAAVANFTVASTPRTFDKNSNQWVDGETLFLRCSAWRELAENIAETLVDKGMRIIVSGRLKQRSHDKDGQTRTVVELEVDEVGPSLKYASAKVNRTQRSNGGQQGGGNNWGGGQQTQHAASDPWGTSEPSQDPGGWGTGPGGVQDPPF